MNSLWSYVIAALAVLATGFLLYKIGYVRGNSLATVNCVTEQSKSDNEGKKKHDEIEKKVIALPDPDLDAFLDRWMRD